MKYIILIISTILSIHSFAQSECYDGDTNIWENTWQSCQASTNPNPARGQGHWIQYDLGQERLLGKTHIWNANSMGQVDRGFRQVAIDYSTDGSEWQELGIYEFERATGEAIYGGFAGPDFERTAARYVIFTATL